MPGLILDGAAMAEMLRGPEGPVGRHLIERATVFQAAAKATVAPHTKTGCLAGTINKRPLVEASGGLSITVVSDTSPCSPTRTSYSLFVHEGTEPHPIAAKNGGMLAFFWANGPNGPGMYFFREVQHPGTQAVPFLRDNLGVFSA